MNRWIWYSFSTPVATTVVAPARPVSASNASHRRGVPAAASTQKTVTPRTSVVPRSGWSRTSTIGTAATRIIATTSPSDTRACQRPSLRSARTSAMAMTTASLASSEGWTCTGPSVTHDFDPLIVVPITSTSTSPTIAPR